jgi:tetratricopeptide (TPR) repeat protein
MKRDDWYRRTTWTELDRDEFDDRLRRSRDPSSKAQYLRIQALCLAKAGLHSSAIELVDRSLTEYPDQLEVGQVHLQKASSLANLEQYESAVGEFRSALQAERDRPNVRTQAWLDFAWFVLQKQRTNLYDEALTVLTEFSSKSSMSFPIDRYRYAAARALIADARGEKTSSRQFAISALAEASATNSGFRYHAKLGIVGPEWDGVNATLRRLAQD